MMVNSSLLVVRRIDTAPANDEDRAIFTYSKKKINSDLLTKQISGYGCRGEKREQTKSVA